ncbi:DUF4442 domain-containing protein [archaeon]|nr:MAG: DUF4442 domain-containing protein [archaeon]
MGPIMTKMGKVLNIYKTLEPYPLGKWLFSLLFCLAAPYFFSIKPQVNEMKPGYCKYHTNHMYSVLEMHMDTCPPICGTDITPHTYRLN